MAAATLQPYGQQPIIEMITPAPIPTPSNATTTQQFATQHFAQEQFYYPTPIVVYERPHYISSTPVVVREPGCLDALFCCLALEECCLLFEECFLILGICCR